VGTYDAENRLSTVIDGSVSTSYFYDAQNRRIYSSTGTRDVYNNPTNYTVNIYTLGGQKLGAYVIAPAFVNNPVQATMQVTLSSNSQYFGGRMLAAMDQLGSVGTYYPWGENKGGTNPQDNFSFATYWRDSATSLDYANNRYYSNAYGRFMTPDPYMSNSGGFSEVSQPTPGW
jgi:RHS repeat-associated protein